MKAISKEVDIFFLLFSSYSLRLARSPSLSIKYEVSSLNM